MIYCPECGTANRDGSRYCNECGQRLDASTRVKCPECGAMNPTERTLCSECGGRLLPLNGEPEGSDAPPAAKGPSLPAKSLPSDEEGGSAAEEPADLEKDTLAWLHELGGRWLSNGEATVGGASEASDDIPDWLMFLKASLPDEQETLPEESEPPERATAGPPWVGVSEKGEEVPLTEAEGKGVPDWLAKRQDAAGADEEEPEELRKAEQGETTPWPADLQGMAGAEAPDQQVPDLEEGESPDQAAEPGQQGPELPERVEPEPEAPVTMPDEEEAADWLAEMHLGTEIEESEIPDWLAEMRILTEEEEWEEGGPPTSDEEEAFPAAAVPRWLEELQTAALAESPTMADQEAEAGAPDWFVPEEEAQEEILAQAEIPEWLLALKPAELREEEEPERHEPMGEEPIEGTGLLAGLQGILPAETIIAQPRVAAGLEAVGAPIASDAPQVRLFAEIVSRPLQAAPQEMAQPERRKLGLLPRSFIYIALVAVVSLPLLLGAPLLSRTPEIGLPVQNLYQEIESLDNGALVLVAFDYDPSTADEMNPLAHILVDHLMERQVGIVAVSLYPAGPPVAQAMLDELAAQRSDYAGTYGQRYVNLGYLPGQAIAVRLLGQSLSLALPQDFRQTLLADLPLMSGVGGIEDLALIIELAASEQSVRWWVEQAAMPCNVPLAGGVSASVVPLAQPYYQTEPRQLVGLAGGLPGAAAYATLRGDSGAQEGALAARMDSLTGGHLVFVLVLVVGSVVQVLRGSRGGR